MLWFVGSSTNFSTYFVYNQLDMYLMTLFNCYFHVILYIEQYRFYSHYYLCSTNFMMRLHKSRGKISLCSQMHSTFFFNEIHKDGENELSHQSIAHTFVCAAICSHHSIHFITLFVLQQIKKSNKCNFTHLATWWERKRMKLFARPVKSTYS